MTISVEELAQKLAEACGIIFPPPQPVAAAAPAESVASPALAAVPPPPPNPVQITDYAAKGVHLDVTVPSSQVAQAAKVLSQHGFAIDAVTGVDWMAAQEMEVVYDYFHPTSPLRVAVRARIPRSNPEIPTISDVFSGANWHERETHDFFGINFRGHPDLTPLLLPEDANFHPLRKDFAG